MSRRVVRRGAQSPGRRSAAVADSTNRSMGLPLPIGTPVTVSTTATRTPYGRAAVECEGACCGGSDACAGRALHAHVRAVERRGMVHRGEPGLDGGTP